ncbi:unnamed protein product [Gongylonema pulchrum]|uniref:Uncharacterized protein n=1 Tax=Gongylonema pulchrum TaxID=637853 RepID=A0A183DW87_9BILA|nr:unnamed protein product [Gongylonema pulchrum]VDN43629.1 unnamed protein product [Gongylonema pulchrum]
MDDVVKTEDFEASSVSLVPLSTDVQRLIVDYRNSPECDVVGTQKSKTVKGKIFSSFSPSSWRTLTNLLLRQVAVVYTVELTVSACCGVRSSWIFGETR